MGYVLKAVLSSAQHPEYGQIKNAVEMCLNLRRIRRENDHA